MLDNLTEGKPTVRPRPLILADRGLEIALAQDDNLEQVFTQANLHNMRYDPGTKLAHKGNSECVWHRHRSR